VWKGYPVEGYYDICWLMWLWSTQAKVQGIVLRAAWYWDSDSSVINDPLEEPGHTPFYVGLLFTWSSVDGDRSFPPFSGSTP
jgi:hypothetical protein